MKENRMVYALLMASVPFMVARLLLKKDRWENLGPEGGDASDTIRKMTFSGMHEDTPGMEAKVPQRGRLHSPEARAKGDAASQTTVVTATSEVFSTSTRHVLVSLQATRIHSENSSPVSWNECWPERRKDWEIFRKQKSGTQKQKTSTENVDGNIQKRD
jgi:hypothetical protein